MSLLRPALLLLAVTLFVTWPQAGLQDWTGTEGRRVQIALEMARGGDWLVPTLFHEPTLAKPPLHYWLLALLDGGGTEDWYRMRLPSIALLWALSVLAFGLHRRAFGAAAAWVAALGVCCAPMAVSQFASAEIDPVFACFTAGSLWLLAFGVARERRDALFWGGALGALALLTKGPPYFVFAAGAWLVWFRRRRMRGFLVYAAPLLLPPVAYYAYLAFGADVGDLSATASEETVGRLFTYQWHHVLDTPEFLLKALLVQLPLVCWCFWEFRSTRDARMGPEDLTLRMCSGAAVLAVFLLALFPGKPTRYLLPNVPLFTFAVAPAAAHYATRCHRLGGFARGVLRGLGFAGAVLLVALPFLPAPVPLRTAAFAIACGLMPWLVRTPRALVAMVFWLPALAAWTVLADFRDRWEHGPRARTVHGARAGQELGHLGGGLGRESYEAWGHVHGGLVLGIGALPRGNEAATRQPTAPLVLREAERWPPLPELEGYRVRTRLFLPKQTFVIEERAGR
ncbi:MAG: ArnT family glycosyltransferase [Planctomycetota bacterium]